MTPRQRYSRYKGRRYYYRHREEILARKRLRYQRRKAGQP